MQTTVLPVSKLSKKYQTVVPKKIRRDLGLKSGQKLFWKIIKDKKEKKLEVVPAPKSWAKYMRGLGKEVWRGVDVDEYIRELRDEWDRPIR